MEDMKYTNPLDGLYEIVGDLWNKQKLQEAADAMRPHDQTGPESGVSAPGQTAAPQTRPHTGLPSFDQIWKTADESIDWTDILSSRNTMGLDPKSSRWQFLCSHAGDVLSGSLKAYGEVLQEVRPLDDMKPYAHHIRVKCDSPDEISVSFRAFEDDAQSHEAAYALYLCGIALRCARDIFAVLPVTTVHVKAAGDGDPLLDVVFHRSDMQKTLFSFIDPVDFVRGLGAKLDV